MHKPVVLLSGFILFASAFLQLCIPSVSAEMTGEILELSYTRQCDFHRMKDTDPLDISGDPGACNAVFWETNRTWLYWGNTSSTIDSTSDYGIGKAIFGLTDPVGTSPYWTVDVTYWTSIIAFLSPTWSEIGSARQSVSGVWSAGNLGIGYTAVDRYSSYLVHTQMHTQAEQDSWWWINGESPTDQPPDAWNRPTTGTQKWDFDLNTLENRPFTLAEIKNLNVILEINILPSIWAYLSSWQVNSQLSIGIGGLSVSVTPADYTPPDYSGSFVLWPELESGGFTTNDVDRWRNESDSNDTYALTVAVNETPIDQDTYIWTNWTSINIEDPGPGSNFVTFNFTDIPSSFASTMYGLNMQYYAYLWMIAKCDNQDYNTQLYIEYMDSAYYESYPHPNTYPTIYKQMTVRGISEYYANYSMQAPVAGVITSAIYDTYYGPFTYSQLNDLVATLILMYPYNATDDYDYWAGLGKVQIAQIGMLCVPYDLSNNTYMDEYTENNVNSLIWLLIIFLPAMALGVFIPKLGFFAGMAIMLGLFGATVSGFAFISLIGFVAIGVAYYKGN